MSWRKEMKAPEVKWGWDGRGHQALGKFLRYSLLPSPLAVDQPVPRISLPLEPKCFNNSQFIFETLQTKPRASSYYCFARIFRALLWFLMDHLFFHFLNSIWGCHRVLKCSQLASYLFSPCLSVLKLRRNPIFI